MKPHLCVKENSLSHVLIIHEVEAYSTWKPIFDQAAAMRKAAGEISYQLLRDDQDKNKIVHFRYGLRWQMHVSSSNPQS